MRLQHSGADIDVELGAQEIWRDPGPLYTRLREVEGLVSCLQPARLVAHGWAVSRYADVQRMLDDTQCFRNDVHSVRAGKASHERWFVPKSVRAVKRSMLFADGPNHKRLRGLASRAFTPARVEQMRRSVSTLVESLWSAAVAKGRFDFMADFATQLPVKVICEMLGLEPEEGDEFTALFARTVNALTLPQLLRVVPEMYARHRCLRRLIERKRAQPGDDLTSALIAAEQEGARLSAEELIGTILLVLVAGHETTINLLGSGTMMLLTQREQLARLVAEPTLLPAGIEEMLRLGGPVQFGNVRYVAQAVELGGQRLERGEVVVPMLGAANLDPTVFEDPTRFDVGRTPNKHVAFGSGPHFCLGAHLSRLEGRLAFERIVPELARFELDCAPAELVWQCRHGKLRGLTRLPLRPRV